MIKLIITMIMQQLHSSDCSGRHVKVVTSLLHNHSLEDGKDASLSSEQVVVHIAVTFLTAKISLQIQL